MNAVYDTYMPDAPAVRTTVQAGLGQGMLVESTRSRSPRTDSGQLAGAS